MSRFLFYDDKIINILLREEKPSGGAAVQAYGWIRGLAEAGQDIHVLTNFNSREALKDECKDLKFLSLYDNKKGVRWLRWIYYRLPYIYKKIKHAKPDYLYGGIPGWESFIHALICRQLNVKFLLRISNDYLLDERVYKNLSKIQWYFLKMGMKLSYCLLCQNDYQLAMVKEIFPNKRVIKISNPIFIKDVHFADEKTSRKYIAWIGLYQYQKNIGLLYEIAKLFKDELFYVAGKAGTNFDVDTSIQLEKLKGLPNVKFVGFLFRNEVLPFLAKAKFLLNTSHYEGFSNTFLEAMSVGTPIISNSKVNPDSIISKYNLGIVYKDVPDLLKQMDQINPNVYNLMSNNVKGYVSKFHNYKKQANKLVSFLNNN